MRLQQSGCVAILWLSRDMSRFNLQLECINKVLQKKNKKQTQQKKLWINTGNNNKKKFDRIVYQ